jgi:hypothetical protein
MTAAMPEVTVVAMVADTVTAAVAATETQPFLK